METDQQIRLHRPYWKGYSNVATPWRLAVTREIAPAPICASFSARGRVRPVVVIRMFMGMVLTSRGLGCA